MLVNGMMRKVALVAIIMGLCSGVCVSQVDYPKYKIKALEKASKLGDGQAAWSLGLYYRAKSPDKAKQWYHKAITNGFSNPLLEKDTADYFLSKRDGQEGEFWLIRAAGHGNADAALDLSNRYRQGHDVVNFLPGLLPKNPDGSIKYSKMYLDNAENWLREGVQLARNEDARVSLEVQTDNAIASARAQAKIERNQALTALFGAVTDALTPPPPSYPSSSGSTSSESSASSSSDTSTGSGTATIADSQPDQPSSQDSRVDQPRASVSAAGSSSDSRSNSDSNRSTIGNPYAISGSNPNSNSNSGPYAVSGPNTNSSSNSSSNAGSGSNSSSNVSSSSSGQQSGQNQTGSGSSQSGNPHSGLVDHCGHWMTAAQSDAIDQANIQKYGRLLPCAAK